MGPYMWCMTVHECMIVIFSKKLNPEHLYCLFQKATYESLWKLKHSCDTSSSFTLQRVFSEKPEYQTNSYVGYQNSSASEQFCLFFKSLQGKNSPQEENSTVAHTLQSPLQNCLLTFAVQSLWASSHTWSKNIRYSTEKQSTQGW